MKKYRFNEFKLLPFLNFLKNEKKQLKGKHIYFEGNKNLKYLNTQLDQFLNPGKAKILKFYHKLK